MWADLVYEAATTMMVIVTGYLLCRRASVLADAKRSVVLAYSLAFGASGVIVVSALTSLLSINGPAVSLLAPLALGAAVAGVRGIGRPVNSAVRELAVVPLVVAVVTLLARFFRWGNLTGDSWHHIANARLLATNRLGLLASTDPVNFEEFAIGYSLFQMHSSWGGHLANFTLGPLLGLAVLILLLEALEDILGRRHVLVSRGLVALVAVAWFFWVISTYVNSHMLVALLILTAYQASRSGTMQDGWDIAAVALLLVVLVLLRVENILVVTLFLATLPFWGQPGPQPITLARWGFFFTGLTTVIIQSLNVFAYRSVGLPLTISTVGLGLLGTALLVVALLTPRLVSWRLLPLRYVLVLLLGANAVYLLVEPGEFRMSVVATARNLFAFDGDWGLLAPFLILAAVGGLLDMRTHGEHRAILRFVRDASLVLFFTGFLRDVPFRVGAGDSLNRQLFHLLPLVVLGVGGWVGALIDRHPRESGDAEQRVVGERPSGFAERPS
jgi:hypothetical protein